MTYWARLSVGWYRDPKVAALSADAELLYVRAIAYTVDEQTDGFVSVQALPIIGSKLNDASSSAAQLCAVKLWRKRRNGWAFPPDTWAKWQTTRDEIAAKRAEAAERQRRSRAARVTRDSHVTEQSVTRDSHVSHAAVTAPEVEQLRERNGSLSTTPQAQQSRTRQDSDPQLMSAQDVAALLDNRREANSDDGHDAD